ncbi:MAG: N-acetylmuramoyl-L-alanine amidase [Actinomycetota bacterium]|nr:N-acetylmuramoyl-L-alanine amidase [Actinomycetota bacterium]
MRQVHRNGAGHVRSSRALTGAGAVVSSTVIALAGSMLPATATPTPATPSTRTVPAAVGSPVVEPTVVRSLDVPATDATFGRGKRSVVAKLEPTPTSTYGLVGVTWEPSTAAAGTSVSLRARVQGSWGRWMSLEVEGDAASAEGDQTREGTDPIWVGAADGVAVRVISRTDRAPRDLSVETVEPDRAPLAAGVSSRTGTERLPSGFPAMPDVVTRQEWGADPALGDRCSDPKYGSAARAVVVHHTVNSNSYAASDSPAMMRSILAYHTQSQGWCDIGYNFVVDRYGTIFEGRRGGIRRPVRGAHAGDYNTDTVGVSMLGDFEAGRVTRPLKNAMVRLIGWRLGTSYMPARGRTKTRIHDRRLKRILGHRDVMSTVCPGEFGYAFLPRLRDRVAAYVSEYDSPIKARADELGASVTGPVFEGERFAAGGLRTDFANGAMFNKRGLGTHWLKGATRRAYKRVGGVYGALGYPKTDALRTGVSGVFLVRFEGGSIYRVGKKRGYLVRGRIMLRYRKRGGVEGRLGAPTVTLTRNGSREKVTFEHGRIVHNRESGALNVIFS